MLRMHHAVVQDAKQDAKHFYLILKGADNQFSARTRVGPYKQSDGSPTKLFMLDEWVPEGGKGDVLIIQFEVGAGEKGGVETVGVTASTRADAVVTGTLSLTLQNPEIVFDGDTAIPVAYYTSAHFTTTKTRDV